MRNDCKFLIVTASAYTFGGVPHWLSYIVPGLESLGWAITVGLVSGPRFHRPEKFLREIKFRDTCVIHTRTCTPESRVRAVMRCVERLHPDLVLGVNVADTYEGCRRARLRGWQGRMVMALHGLEAGYYLDLKRLKPHLDAAIGTNRLTCRAIEIEGGLSADRIEYAPCGVEVGTVDPRTQIGERMVLAYSGRLEQTPKRIHDLTRILTVLERRKIPVDCLIAGNGPEEEAIRTAFTSMRLHNVEMLGCLPADQLPQKVYGRADILVITSSWETGPIVAWEAMANGVAVVSSRYTGYRAEQALRDGENCRLFDVGNIEQAAECIADLHHDRQMLLKLAEGGRQLVESRYTRHISVQSLDKALKRIMQRPALPACRTPVWQHAPAGRLDRWLGIKRAETLRTLLGCKANAGDPGSEWPHAYNREKPGDKPFSERLAQLEQTAVWE